MRFDIIIKLILYIIAMLIAFWYGCSASVNAARQDSFTWFTLSAILIGAGVVCFFICIELFEELKQSFK